MRTQNAKFFNELVINMVTSKISEVHDKLAGTGTDADTHKHARTPTHSPIHTLTHANTGMHAHTRT